MASFNDSLLVAIKRCYYKKWATPCEYSLGIAKHLYIRTVGQPTNMSCPLCLVYTS